MFCCIKYKEDEWKPNAFSQHNWLQSGFQSLGRQLQNKGMKIFVLLLTLTFAAFGIYGNTQIAVEFDFVKFLPHDSNLAKWFGAHKAYFPTEGYRGNIYVASKDLKK